MTTRTLDLDLYSSVAPDKGVRIARRYNESGPRGARNTIPGLTHSTDITREGLAMKATRILPTRDRVSLDPHPELAEAVTVSRFWRMVRMGDSSECWAWTGQAAADGYGSFFYHGEMRRSHEMALSFSTGEMRHPDLVTCHSCDNPRCCNPSHLRFDTPGSNLKEAYDRGLRSGTDIPAWINDEKVRLMRERRALGARVCDLAADFKISPTAASLILRGLSRAKAGGPITPAKKWTKRQEESE